MHHNRTPQDTRRLHSPAPQHPPANSLQTELFLCCSEYIRAADCRNRTEFLQFLSFRA